MGTETESAVREKLKIMVSYSGGVLRLAYIFDEWLEENRKTPPMTQEEKIDFINFVIHKMRKGEF